MILCNRRITQINNDPVYLQNEILAWKTKLLIRLSWWEDCRINCSWINSFKKYISNKQIFKKRKTITSLWNWIVKISLKSSRCLKLTTNKSRGDPFLNPLTLLLQMKRFFYNLSYIFRISLPRTNLDFFMRKDLI